MTENKNDRDDQKNQSEGQPAEGQPTEEQASENIYQTDYEIGQDNIQIMGMDLHNPVFWLSAMFVLVFVVGSIAFPEQAFVWLSSAKSFAINQFDWLFMASFNLFIVFCLVLVALPISKLRLGGADAKPEFSLPSWFAMLFAAGMGIGLMFWGVAEPVAYFTNWFGTPLNVEAKTDAAASLAMAATIFHWGFQPWAVYAIVGLSLAFFTYNKGLPLTIRSVFYPILGERTWGWIGHVIDVLAVLATIFGLATSLGLGAKQAASGFNFLFGWSSEINMQIAIVIGITGLAVISVVRGLDGGVKMLSNVNMWLAILLLLFVFLAGPTGALLGWIFETARAYVVNVIPLSNWIGREDSKWMHDWTVFYWAWWVSWSPFVGMFIARVSRGRTIREFVAAVLLVPTLVVMIWMAVFGGTAIEQIKNGVGELAAKGITDSSLATFQMFSQLPFTGIISFVGIILVLVFFVTSSDSGSLVIDSITAGGKLEAPVPQRIFWAVLEGLIACALLFSGGKKALEALQAGAISTGLPFTIVVLVMCVSLYVGLRHEYLHGPDSKSPDNKAQSPESLES